MRIVSIFADKLFSFHYEDQEENEYDRLIERWTDVNYLFEFGKMNVENYNINRYVKSRLEDAEQIINLIEDISNDSNAKLEMFFRPLSNSEYTSKTLSLQKGKTSHWYRKNDLRFYAIKIDENCFVITGGAIKLSQVMQENEYTQAELVKLKRCRAYLKENGVYDNESFFELIFNGYE